MKLGVHGNSLNLQNFGVVETIEYAAQAGLDTVQLHRGKLASLEAEYLRSVKERADARGVRIELQEGCIDRFGTNFRAEKGTPEQVLRTAIGAAQALGSPVVQVFMGNLQNRLASVPFEQRLDGVAAVIQAVAPLIEETGVRPAIENHGDTTARELAAFIERVGPDYTGVCLDIGNPTVIAEDPALTTEILAPYTLMTHIRDSLVWAVEDGALTQWVPMGAGNTDLPRIAGLLREHAPNTSFCLELITGGAPKPVPYLVADAELWRTYPHTQARDFARYVALARKGPAGPVGVLLRPEQGEPDGDLRDALREQQRRHFAESFEYCRAVLGMGERER